MYTFILECHHDSGFYQIDRMDTPYRYFSFDSGTILRHARSMALLYGINGFVLEVIRIDRSFADIDRIWG